MKPTPYEMPSRHQGLSRSLPIVVLVFAVAVVAIVVSFTRSSPDDDPLAELPRLGTVPDFVFIDQDGKEFSSAALAGKVWVADFFFTRCSAACPRMTTRMLELQRELEAEQALAGKVHLVSFSVDPRNDDPAALSEFARSYGVDTDSWTFLTGKAGEVSRLSQTAFLLGAADSPPGGSAASPAATHSDRFCLVDQAGNLRGHYRPTETPGELTRLVRDLRRLVDETVPQL